MITIRTIHGDRDTLEGIEDSTPALELSAAIGLQGRIEREKPGATVILYHTECIS